MKRLIVLASAILLLAAACNKQTAVPTPTPTPNNSTDQTTDWKTYTNTKYGFQFKYPENWQINAVESTENNVPATKFGGRPVLSISFGSNNNQDATSSVTLQVYPNQTATSLIKYFDLSPSQFSSKASIGGVSAIEAAGNGSFDNPLVLFFDKGNYGYELRDQDRTTFQTSLAITNQIISTFKFTK